MIAQQIANIKRSAIATGTDNYDIVFNPEVTELFIGLKLSFMVQNNNTGVSTLSFGSFGPITLKKNGIDDLELNDIEFNKIYVAEYDGTYLQIIGGPKVIGKTTLDDLSEFTVTSPNVGDILVWNGTTFENQPNSGTGIDGSGTADYFPLWSDSDTLTNSPLSIVSNRLVFDGITSGFTGSEEIKGANGIQTTDATVTNLTTISLSNGEMITIEGTVNGFKSDFSKSYGAKFFAVFRKTGGTITQVSTSDVIEKTEFTTATITVDSDGTTNIRIRVTGESSNTINWTTIYTYQKTLTDS